ncbi:hypothetical protein MACH05_22080 [Qipengyuania nanhaisediminis]
MNEAMNDRRAAIRHRTMFRPCCVIAPQRVSLGLIRNYSANGACIEIDAGFDLAVGDRIQYFWEARNCISAEVVWRDGRSVGVEHVADIRDEDDQFPVRSVRVPCKSEAICWINGEVHTAVVENISLGGIRLRGLPDTPAGTLFTVTLCGMEFASVAVRWSAGGATGARFSQRLCREDLAALLLDERFGITGIGFDKEMAS